MNEYINTHECLITYFLLCSSLLEAHYDSYLIREQHDDKISLFISFCDFQNNVKLVYLVPRIGDDSLSPTLPSQKFKSRKYGVLTNSPWLFLNKSGQNTYGSSPLSLSLNTLSKQLPSILTQRDWRRLHFFFFDSIGQGSIFVTQTILCGLWSYQRFHWKQQVYFASELRLNLSHSLQWIRIVECREAVESTKLFD